MRFHLSRKIAERAGPGGIQHRPLERQYLGLENAILGCLDIHHGSGLFTRHCPGKHKPLTQTAQDLNVHTSKWVCHMRFCDSTGPRCESPDLLQKT